MATERWRAVTPTGQQVRLSEAAWTQKILVSHPEFSEDPHHEEEVRRTLEDPEFIVEGWEGELLSL